MSASPPICVIGVSGFVGSHVAAELLDQLPRTMRYETVESSHEEMSLKFH